MKRTFTIICLVLIMTMALGAQDKVTKTVLELGRTDNRTMEHADYIARNIGGRLVGSLALFTLCFTGKTLRKQSAG